jgi:hypothetical protein
MDSAIPRPDKDQPATSRSELAASIHRALCRAEEEGEEQAANELRAILQTMFT